MDLPEILAEQREFLESTLRPSVEISFELRPTKPWESKLGGCPYLADAADYPRDSEGRPMMFLAQLNLDDMPPLPDFPHTGLLQFFVGDDELYGLEEKCEVRYLAEYQRDEAGLLTENPFEADYQGYQPFYKAGAMIFSPDEKPITTECEAFSERFFEKVSNEQWDALYEVCYADGCRVGGYPVFVQHSPEYYDDGECDVLLLQLDIDDETGIMFGDSGNCTFLISREALQKCDFSEVEYDWQCC